MNNSTYYSLIKGTSKISPKTRLGLIISIVLVLLIAIIVLILSFWYKKKAIKKYLSPIEQEEINKLKINNPNYGVVLNGIQPLYKDYINDFLTCFLINTIYINKYKKVYLESDNDYLAISIANLVNGIDVEYNGYFDKKIREDIIEKYPELNFENIKTVSKSQNVNDFMLFFKEESNIKNIIDNKLNLLSDKGMAIVLIKNFKSIKNYKNLLKEYDLRYETLKFKNKSVILLAKGNIKNRIEKGE
ncbi:hypothetical protein DMC14_000090 [Metamycoplasma phocicerebrale]|uniref:Uncharacterized protein n=1 Tax=Metamycoplasma phocicerebrale TaxID=142649 RepID=A0A3T0TTB6_9BACT|nr:hypothetical protein [Metamycoplasma phocicerebrale]AZZ65216.1 hypothetical protein DMC14_000090 [Metamycoplasma phocicerebrale]